MYQLVFVFALVAAVCCSHVAPCDDFYRFNSWMRPQASAQDAFCNHFNITAFQTAHSAIRESIVKTPLVRIQGNATALFKQPIFLKDEVHQPIQNFKIRGSTFQVQNVIRRIIESGELLDRQHSFKLVTQSTGNQGVATIEAVAASLAALLNAEEYPLELLAAFEPVVFATRSTPEVKIRGMMNALTKYREIVKNNSLGVVNATSANYGEALHARQAYLLQHSGRSIYLDHSGHDITLGHGSAGLEIAEQLRDYGIEDHEFVIFAQAPAAGGSLGVGTALKLARPNTFLLLVQDSAHPALVRSLATGQSCTNPRDFDRARLLHNTSVRIDFLDGIAVDAPEGSAVSMARCFADAAVVVDQQQVLDLYAPLLYEAPELQVIGGTGAATLAALLHPLVRAQVNQARALVMFGCEGNIDASVRLDVEVRAKYSAAIIQYLLALGERELACEFPTLL